MNNTIKCPSCGAEILAEDGRTDTVCPICGTNINAADAEPENIDLQISDSELSQLRQKMKSSFDGSPEDCGKYAKAITDKIPNDTEANYYYAVSLLTDKLTTLNNVKDIFSRDKYPERFKDYEKKLFESLDALNTAYINTDDKEKLINDYASVFAQKLSKSAKGSKVTIFEDKITDACYQIVVFAVPAVLDYQREYSDKIADIIINYWNDVFPKRKLKKITYEEIIKGFKRKLCYITTAVCGTFNKPDSCYELTQFRRFRDEWLLTSEEGKRLADEYYFIAPFIVGNIDSMPDSKKIYSGIWDKYLCDCLKFIESGENEKCRDKYIKMVRNLQKKYI